MQCPLAMLPQRSQVPAFEQYCPSPQELAMQVPAEQWCSIFAVDAKQESGAATPARNATAVGASCKMPTDPHFAGRWRQSSPAGTRCTARDRCTQCSARQRLCCSLHRCPQLNSIVHSRRNWKCRCLQRRRALEGQCNDSSGCLQRVLGASPCWQVGPVQPCWHAMHCQGPVQATQRPSPMVLQRSQVPAAEQYCPSPQEVAMQVPAVKRKQKAAGGHYSATAAYSMASKTHSVGRCFQSSQVGTQCIEWR